MTRLRERMRARFDRTMDRGTPALIGLLALASGALVVVVSGLALLLAPGDTQELGVRHVLWMSLLRTLDPGTMGSDTGSVVFLALMLAITVGGIFVVSALIGVLTTGLDNRIAELRKGRSRVIETGHAVILGWSEQVFIVISELAKANQGGRRSSVVILADRDKVGMEDQIKARVSDVGRLRVMCRSGNPLKRGDLELVNPDAARSIMVLSPSNGDADIDVIKVLLLLKHRQWAQARPHVVAAMQETANMPAARLAAGPDTQLVDADDIAVRLVVQSHRMQGLATVCTDLLDFSGNEIYMRAEPRLVGVSYGAALDAYERGCPIGLRRRDGRVAINPSMDSIIEDGDEVIVIAEDDLLIRLAEQPTRAKSDAVVVDAARVPLPDRTLLVGWNSRGPKIVDLLDRLVEIGSHVDIAAPAEPPGVVGPRTTLTVGYRPCDPTSRRSLEALEPGRYKHVVVLSDEGVAPDRADDRSLVTLLHLRDIEVSLGGDPYSIVTEMNDDANREVAQITQADDFIVSSKLITLLMTQLAENKHLHKVFAELFDPSGSEIYLKPASSYVNPGTELNFATVVESARRRSETAIGYLLKGREEAHRYGVVLNPDKAAPLTLGADDSVIVVAVD